MAEEVRIRAARVKDMAVLTRLWRELIGFHEALGGQDFRLAPGAEATWRKYLRSHIGKKDRLCLVADLNAAAVGFLLGGIEKRPPLFMERDYGHLSDVYVQEPHRGKGVGKALVTEAQKWFEARRIGRVRLNTDARNTLGADFWKKMGWQTTVLIMDKLI